ncbi:MAG: hypothetical protein NWE93_06565 [Candidatus Bathyarchaeota archaeon]|nr:hypothetical protein [Candidatus Bathyarchaeota archaeon]
MKKRIAVLAILLTTVLAASLVLGVTANWGWTRNEYVGYKFQAVLNNPVVTVTANPPMMIVDGYRPASGIVSCNVTIDGKTYVYPKDFSYQETFHVEANQATGKGIMLVTTTLTFNLPGRPVITEYLTQQVTTVNGQTTVDESVFYLTGARTCSNVEGGGFTMSTGASGTDYALHIGLIKGWPL